MEVTKENLKEVLEVAEHTVEKVLVKFITTLVVEEVLDIRVEKQL
jgi:hypothetical protein